MKLSTAGLIGVGTLAVAGLIWGAQPFVEMLRFDNLTRRLAPGDSVEAALALLGPADQRWDSERVVCVNCHPCHPTKQQGPVLFYRRGPACGVDFGWYLFFGSDGRLIEIEGTGT